MNPSRAVPKIAIVIPCYRAASSVCDVIRGVDLDAARIIVVDDGCPDGSGNAADALGRPDVTVLRHERNRGVGAAMVTGYRAALARGCDVVVKMDGDGQMDPTQLARFVEPLLADEADYAKGNRFRDFAALRAMPRLRLVGNSALSFLVKAASGYWDTMDPTNGYTAIHRRVLERLDLDRISQRYYFESDMMIELGAIGAVVRDVALPARYGAENSSLRVDRVLVEFPPKLLAGLSRRIFLRYFVYDFNMASIYLLLGLPMLALSTAFGLFEWIESMISGVPRTAGTIMLAALPFIISFQMLLQAVQIDIASVPRKSR